MEEEQTICSNCGAAADRKEVYCAACGYVVDNSSLDTFERTMHLYKLIGIISLIIILLYFFIELWLPL